MGHSVRVELTRPRAASGDPTPAQVVARLMEGESAPSNTRQLRSALESLCQRTGSARAAASELEWLLSNYPHDLEAIDRYVKLVTAGEGVELATQRQAFAAVEKSGEKSLPGQYRQFLTACDGRPSVAWAEYQWLDKLLPARTPRAAALEHYRKVVERSQDAPWERRRQVFLNQRNGVAEQAAPPPPPHIQKVYDSMVRMTGDRSLADRELQELLKGIPAGDQAGRLARYLKLLEQGDGVELPSVREAFLHLEQADIHGLFPAYVRLMQACGSPSRALSELRWIEGQTPNAGLRPQAVDRYALLVRNGGDASQEQLRQAYQNLNRPVDKDDVQDVLRTGGTQVLSFKRMPRLADSLDRLTRLTGDPATAAAELKFALDSVRPGQTQEQVLSRYEALVEASEGVQLNGVRAAFSMLEAEANPALEKAFLRLVRAGGGQADQAAAELKWLRDKKPADLAKSVHLYADLLETCGERSSNLQKAYDVVASLPAPHLAVRQLPELLQVGVDLPEAANDLKVLYDNL
ncbi:MAG: hypothetical protein AB1758_27120, partial [Candidatus Eremiobacterota bacterium]